jgi:hypothetical protein
MVNLFIVYLKMLKIVETLQHQMEGQLMNNELERMWQEAVIAHFKVLSQNLPQETEENHKNTVRKVWCPAKIQDNS